MSKYKVWKCKSVVPADSEIPFGFDSPPRMGARQAVLDAGIEVVAIFSGWDGSLTDIELGIIED